MTSSPTGTAAIRAALDHAILNPTAKAAFLGGGYLRIDADFNEVGFRGNFNTRERYSHHDPIFVRLCLGAEVTPRLTVAKTVLAFNRGTGKYGQTISFANKTANSISGPAQLVSVPLTFTLDFSKPVTYKAAIVANPLPK